MIVPLKELNLRIEWAGEMWHVKCKEFRVFSHNKKLDDAITGVFEKFESFYDSYVNDTSLELTKDAIELREKLKEYFKEVKLKDAEALSEIKRRYG